MHVLEIRADVFEIAYERRLRVGLPGCEAWQHLVTGNEHVRQAFVAVYVDERIDAGLLHAFAYQKNFGAGFHTGIRPFSIQIRTGGVGAQIAVDATIRIHVRHQVQHRHLKQAARNRIRTIQ